MENNNQYTIDKLNHLIAIAEDGKEGYENAAKNIDDVSMKSSFIRLSQKRDHYAEQLRTFVKELSGDAENEGGGVLGVLHRAWIDVKATFTSGDSDAIINACITGEETAVNDYKSIMDDAMVSQSFKHTISIQLGEIEEALLNLKSKVSA